jgi:hypothetical protein
MRGSQLVDVKDPDGARAALARAVAGGALGPGRATKVDLASDGRVTWELSLARLETRRAAEAVLVATATSVAATLGLGAIVYVSLGAGALVGGAWAAARIALDRARARRRVAALLASLPLLVDAGRK